MTRKIPPEAEELLKELQQQEAARSWSRNQAIGAAIGAVIGAPLGFIALLVVFGGLFGGDGQVGLAALFLGVPFGTWMGAKVGAREARD